MNAKKTFGICVGFAVLLSGCAGNENLLLTENLQRSSTPLFAENLQRTDTITSYAGDSVARNIAMQTIDPTPYRSRNRHIHFSGQRMNDVMKIYETPSKAPESKVKGTSIGKF